MLNRLLTKLSTRKCRGNCRTSDEGLPSPHTSHLTWIGRRRYGTEPAA